MRALARHAGGGVPSGERAPRLPLSTLTAVPYWATPGARQRLYDEQVLQAMAASNTNSHPGHLRIATEEAWATREMLDLYRRMLAANTLDDPGFKSLWGFYLNSPSPRATFIIDRLQELGQPRLDDMDKSGIDKQILMLTKTRTAFSKSAFSARVSSVYASYVAAGRMRAPSWLHGRVNK